MNAVNKGCSPSRDASGTGPRPGERGFPPGAGRPAPFLGLVIRDGESALPPGRPGLRTSLLLVGTPTAGLECFAAGAATDRAPAGRVGAGGSDFPVVRRRDAKGEGGV